MFSFGGLKGFIKHQIKEALKRRRGYRINELSVRNFSLDQLETSPRVNLVIPAIGAAHAFGGITTALRFFESARQFFPRSRICVLDEDFKQFEAIRWPSWSVDPAGNSQNSIAFLKGSKVPLGLEPGDTFIATHWATALFVKAAREKMRASFQSDLRPFVYLVQDFEPGFYAWSSQYILAESTYAKGKEIIAVFNTELLRDYFLQAGYCFLSSYYFEPSLNPMLASLKTSLIKHPKKKLILVYGRPETSRNAFELVIETLHMWSSNYPDAHSWQLISLGEKHHDIVLNRGSVLRSMGKVSVEQYGNYLLDAAAGLALMVSPHPSYPPLEMAEFGVRVVTNQFANKDLSSRSTNILSVSEASPEALSDALIKCCEQYTTANCHVIPSAFLGQSDEFPFMKNLCDTLLAPQVVKSRHHE
jgi:hypothetical protein